MHVRCGVSAAIPRERRLLVLSYHYPSDGQVGGLRWAGLTKYLGELGWKSWILTAAAPDPRWSAPNVAVESCPAGRTVTDLYRRLRDLIPAIARTRRGSESTVLRSWLRPFRALRAELAGVLGLLHEGHGWTARSALHARALIAQIQPNAIVTTGPPHAAHLAGWLATRGRAARDVRWIADFRDPWAGPFGKAWESDATHGSAIARGFARRAERRVINAASGVFTTTRELAGALSNRYPDAAISWVPNAVDRDLLPARSDEPFPGLAIAHVGTLYGGRDLGAVLRAMRVLRDSPQVSGAGIKLRQVGDVELPQAEMLRRDIPALGLDNAVELRGMLPRREALDVLARSSLALVLAQDQDCQIPAKLYESVAMGIPTLVIAPVQSAAGREAVRIGALQAEPDDVQGIAAAMLQAAQEPNGRNGGRSAAATDYRALAPAVSALLLGEQPQEEEERLTPRRRSAEPTAARAEAAAKKSLPVGRAANS